MRKNNGFTMVELLMVVIIIGILVTIAVPNQMKALERSKGGKAKANLGAIRSSESWYRAQNDNYTATIADLTDYGLPVQVVTADKDWSYAIAGTGPATMTITATRLNGPYSGSSIVINHDGILSINSTTPW